MTASSHRCILPIMYRFIHWSINLFDVCLHPFPYVASRVSTRKFLRSVVFIIVRNSLSALFDVIIHFHTVGLSYSLPTQAIRVCYPAPPRVTGVMHSIGAERERSGKTARSAPLQCSAVSCIVRIKRKIATQNINQEV